MSWLFSRVLAEEYSRATCSAGESCAQLNVMPTAQPFWRNDKPMDCSRFSRFGLTCRVLTDTRGAALLTWFLAGFPARTSASPDLESASRENAAACGFRWPESFAKYDLASRTWKTRQLSLLADSTAYSETWPRWGSMRNGECLELPMSALPIFERGSGLLPTPCVVDSGSLFNRSTSENSAVRPTLGAMARHGLWPTPTCGGGGQSVAPATTPTGKTADGGKLTISLECYVRQVERQLWPTPTVHGNYNRKGASPKAGDGLATAVQTFPTPTVAMHRGSSPGALTRRSGRSRENDRLDYTIERDIRHGRLNPTWVEWLMGWPSGWTALSPLGMDKFREWQRQHGICFSEFDSHS